MMEFQESSVLSEKTVRTKSFNAAEHATIDLFPVQGRGWSRLDFLDLHAFFLEPELPSNETPCSSSFGHGYHVAF
jgi:hypothetical protein